MSPLLIVSVTAFMGLTLCNLAWSRYARGQRARNQLLEIELRNLRAEAQTIPVLRADLSTLALRIQELTRGLFPGQPLPGTLLSCLDRVDESVEAHRKANRAVRRQLSRTVDRLRNSQKEVQRLQSQQLKGDGSVGDHLRSVTNERNALRSRLDTLKRSLQQDGADDRVRLMHTRKELEELRLQLRSAYRSMADLETQLTLNTSSYAPLDQAEMTEMVMVAAPSEFEIM